MIHYARVIMACVGELWAIDEAKLHEITAFLMLKAEGGMVAPEDLARITQKQQREVAAAPGDIALLPVFGTLAPRMNMMADLSDGGGTSMMQLAATFRAALADPGIKAIVFDHDSPGGTAAGTGELAAEILDSRGVKPIIAQINHTSASAAYWLASAADEIVVTPGGQAGSLGVYRIHEDVSKMLEQKGIKPTIIASDGSPFKVEDTNTQPLSAEALAHHKERVNQVFDRMVRSIAEGRGTTLTAVRDRFGQGRMFGAEELMSRGMADRIDTLEATLERFGSGAFNPVANATRAQVREAAACVDGGKELIAKVKAGGQPSRRELEHGIKGLAVAVGETLSNSEAEAAVRLLQMPSSPGGQANPQTEPVVTVAAVANALAPGIADLLNHLRVPGKV